MEVVFHGTRYRNSIMRDNYLRVPEYGDLCVSFTRSFAFAHYYASLSRPGDEGEGHILVFDRPKLKCLYPIVLRDGSWDRDRSEAEEAIYCEVYSVKELLLECIDVATVPPIYSAAKRIEQKMPSFETLPDANTKALIRAETSLAMRSPQSPSSRKKSYRRPDLC